MKNEGRNTTVKKLIKQIEEASQENQALLLSLERRRFVNLWLV